MSEPVIFSRVVTVKSFFELRNNSLKIRAPFGILLSLMVIRISIFSYCIASNPENNFVKEEDVVPQKVKLAK